MASAAGRRPAQACETGRHQQLHDALVAVVATRLEHTEHRVAAARKQRVEHHLGWQFGVDLSGALRFDDPAVHALLGTLVILRLLTRGFANKDLRQNWAQLHGQHPSAIPPGRMTYQLRRLRLHGMIERIPKSHRYRVTEPGMRIAIFFTRTLARLLRPGLSQILPQAPPGDHRLRRDFDRLQATIDSWIDEANMAA